MGLVDRLNSPAFATSVGLLQWAMTMHEQILVPGKARRTRREKGEPTVTTDSVKEWLRRLLP
jgi:cell division protein FtsA